MSRWTSERVAQLRKAAGFKQAELAELLGVARGSVARWEGGGSKVSTSAWPWLNLLEQAYAESQTHLRPNGKPWSLPTLMGHHRAVPECWFRAMKLVYEQGK